MINHSQSMCIFVHIFFGPRFKNKCVLIARILKWEVDKKIEISSLSGGTPAQSSCGASTCCPPPSSSSPKGSLSCFTLWTWSLQAFACWQGSPWQGAESGPKSIITSFGFRRVSLPLVSETTVPVIKPLWPGCPLRVPLPLTWSWDAL